MRLDEYWRKVADNSLLHIEWRYGQSAFNTLHEVRPELAKQIVGTDFDPFYIEDIARDLFKWRKFVDFVKENWYEELA